MASNDQLSGFELFAKRAMDDPLFVGHAIQTFSRAHAMNLSDVADFLGCDSSSLIRLAACRMASLGDESYPDDLDQLAIFVDCDRSRLDQLLREAAGVLVLKKSRATSAAPSTLLAARDRQGATSDEEDEGSGKTR